MDGHLVHTTTNHYPPKMDILPKDFLQIILHVKWLVRNSSTLPNSSYDHCLLFCLFLLLGCKASAILMIKLNIVFA